MEASGTDRFREGDAAGMEPECRKRVPVEVGRNGRVTVGANEGMVASLSDPDTESFWESDKSKKHVQVEWDEPIPIYEVRGPG